MRIVSLSTAVLILAGLSATLLFAGDLTPPPGPVSSTMKTLDQVEPRTPIESLPFDITQPGSYYLTGNLSSTTNGIVIRTSDVTLDLMGFTITGPGPASNRTGILLLQSNGVANVEIKNGTVRSFENGVLGFDGAGGSTGIRIINMRAMDVGLTGISAGGTNALILNCHAELSDSVAQTGEGIGAVGCVVRNSSATGFASGIIAISGSVCEGCTATGNDVGIQCFQSVVKSCVAYNNTTQNLFFGSGVQVDNYAP